MKKSVVVTGGLGFLGIHLCRSLLGEGFRVISIDNLSTGSVQNIKLLPSDSVQDSFFSIQEDVTKESTWRQLDQFVDDGSEFEFVFHFASPASPPVYQKLSEETLWVNSIGLKRALEFSDAVGARCIFASTSEVYGDPEVSPQAESYWGRVNPVGIRACYDESKRFGEALLSTRNRLTGSKHGIVRIFNTYGPGMNPDDGRVVVNLLKQAIKGESLTIYGDGKQTRSFCYVDDLIEGIILFAKKRDLIGPLNVGNSKEFTVLQLAEMIQKLHSGKTLELKFLELPVDDPKQRNPDLSLAKKELNWEAKTSLKEGLRIMRDHLVERI